MIELFSIISDLAVLMIMRPICLASQSIYRRQLLERLDLQFIQQKPMVDEDLLKIQNDHLSPKELCLFLGKAKGEQVHQNRTNPHQITISGDQLIDFQGQILGKTPTPELAFQQLRKLSGQTHTLMTSVFLFCEDRVEEIFDATELTMRELSDQDIERYIQLDQPFDCAGTYKVESFGISLFAEICTKDFTAIQGIPLLALNKKICHDRYYDESQTTEASPPSCQKISKK
jgi:septum formation protein